MVYTIKLWIIESFLNIYAMSTKSYVLNFEGLRFEPGTASQQKCDQCTSRQRVDGDR